MKYIKLFNQIILESKIGDIIDDKWIIIDIIDTGDNIFDLVDDENISLSDGYEKYIEYIAYGIYDKKYYLLDPSYELSIGPCDSLEELNSLCGFE
jgi:hypothetical protein